MEIDIEATIEENNVEYDNCPVHEIPLTDGFCELCQTCYTCK